MTFNYGGTPKALQANTGLPLEECEKMFNNYFESFSGIKAYFEYQERITWEQGYVLISDITNHKSYIPYWKELKWLDDNKNNIINNVWDYYKKGKHDYLKNPKIEVSKTTIVKGIKMLMNGVSPLDISIELYMELPHFIHQSFKLLFKTKSSYKNKSFNMPSQGTSACMTKSAVIGYFKYLLRNNLINIIKIINVVHDEILIEVPDEIAEREALKLKECMEKSSKFFCRKVTIKADPQCEKYWVH